MQRSQTRSEDARARAGNLQLAPDIALDAMGGDKAPEEIVKDQRVIDAYFGEHLDA